MNIAQNDARSRPTGRRAATAAILVVGGGALAAATWANGQHGFAIALIAFYAIAATIAYVWSGGKGDVAAIMRAGGDERQRSIDRQATVVAGYAMGGAAVAGAIVSTARTGDPGAYGIMCLVCGVTYTLSLAFFRFRS